MRGLDFRFHVAYRHLVVHFRGIPVDLKSWLRNDEIKTMVPVDWHVESHFVSCLIVSKRNASNVPLEVAEQGAACDEMLTRLLLGGLPHGEL